MKNGVCGVGFDRRDIEMNKFVVCCLEAQFHVFDARTQHPKKVRGLVSFSGCSGSCSLKLRCSFVHAAPQGGGFYLVCQCCGRSQDGGARREMAVLLHAAAPVEWQLGVMRR